MNKVLDIIRRDIIILYRRVIRYISKAIITKSLYKK